ncbi:MAG: bifunctional sulfate adenylyltransferase/adenylylsulfate kinase [Gammaproteobacteria bacterium]|nr:bifunctional sulfate adenylyltransferase/adenylylsulfate kinase [Gammaproteobacteria bacterium]NIR84752.1 bifunctional sulfate adenylyltransferase/adenylylsulfate kinase [Gammaproteobacteria bacterium]NIR91248.1 bifunctional sulfate adenylyltransferase/adenylylsulfate kinase [Gammaproteobacteria bacterium]NIU05795.1 bifunctional sulfate adenylyltransferase/adenylylsulfate kinase [Gammaproteobacteria bacterium]NIV52914.1 bifunctional sulfate adenylyltransferase/adenylylsulfate kinase [Gammapr
MDDAISAHGGELRRLIVDEAHAEQLKTESLELPSLTLTQRQLCDLELLMNGGFSPLTGFMGRSAYESVVHEMRLPEGDLWPIPVTLDVPAELAATLQPGARLALRDNEGFMLAVLTVSEVFRPDKRREAEHVFGTTSERHPGVGYLLESVHGTYVGGSVTGIQLPTHYDYEELRHTPEELRRLFTKLGWRRVVAFHTSRPMHRLQRELTLEAAKRAQAHILVHPVVGVTRPRDLAYFARVKCYQALEQHYPHGLTTLSLLPLAMRMAGPREALWHALIRRNYGCTHFIVGSDHASPRVGANDEERVYPPYAAQELIERFQDEIAIRAVPFQRLVYAPRRRRFVAEERLDPGEEGFAHLSDAELARRLAHNDEIPSWFTYPEVLRALRKVHPPRNRQGLTLFFTGLSGSGKSTLAKIMYGKFTEAGDRPVTLLDGDIVRRHLSSELGFSKIHRDLNVRRIGFVASEITKNGGVAICAPIAPYAATRRAVREMIEPHGALIEIHISTPLEVCEARDRKGLYAKARKGLIKEFTGISDPYESPEHPELRIDTSDLTPMQAAQEIYLYLLREGYLDPPDPHDPWPGLRTADDE